MRQKSGYNRNLDKHLTQSQKNANTRYETFERVLKRFRGDDNELSDFQCLSKIGQAICLLRAKVCVME